MKSISFEKPQQVSRPLVWWSCVMVLGWLIAIRWHRAAFWSFLAWQFYEFYRGYRQEMVRIR